MSNIAEIDDALSAALHALSAAQATLRKSLPGRNIDVLRKADLLDHSDDAITKHSLGALADLERRTTRIEAQRDMDSQHTTRKTAPYEIRGQS